MLKKSLLSVLLSWDLLTSSKAEFNTFAIEMIQIQYLAFLTLNKTLRKKGKKLSKNFSMTKEKKQWYILLNFIFSLLGAKYIIDIFLNFVERAYYYVNKNILYIKNDYLILLGI